MKKRILLAPVMAIACVLTLVLGGCGGASAEDLIRQNLESYMAYTDDANDEFVSGLEAAAGDDLETLGISSDEFAEAYLDGYDYEIGDITVDGDTATAEVTVTIKSYSGIMSDFEAAFNEYAANLDYESISGPEEIYENAGQLLLDALNNTEPSSVTVEVTYSKNSDGEWEMDSSSADALSTAVMS